MTTFADHRTIPETRALSVTSLVMGIASIAFGWTLIAPVVGLVVGILALSREPGSRAMAVWGIVLNSVMLIGVLFLALLAIVGVGIGFTLLPFALL